MVTLSSALRAWGYFINNVIQLKRTHTKRYCNPTEYVVILQLPITALANHQFINKRTNPNPSVSIKVRADGGPICRTEHGTVS